MSKLMSFGTRIRRQIGGFMPTSSIFSSINMCSACLNGPAVEVTFDFRLKHSRGTWAPPAHWSGPRPTRSAARSRPPRAETLPLPATCRWQCSLLRSRPNQPSHGRGNAPSRPFRLRSLGRGCALNGANRCMWPSAQSSIKHGKCFNHDVSRCKDGCAK